MTASIDEDRRTETALFRYTLILPLLRGEYEPRGKDRRRQQIAARAYDIPHSTRRTVSVPTPSASLRAGSGPLGTPLPAGRFRGPQTALP